MMWIAAVGVGAGLGLAYFGSLWLTVRGVVNQPSRSALVPYGGAIRLVLLGAGLTMLSRNGAGALVGALGGLWLSRWFLLRRLGGDHDAR
jgi:F1F0 ATPase subunit 2